jgi:HEAT repeat protein
VSERDEVEASLAAALRGDRGDQLDRSIVQAVQLGAQGDELLAQALQTARGFDRVVLAAGLGEVDGAAGSAALRKALAATGPGSRDLRCAALLALGKREGAGATPEMLAGLHSRDGIVREYAVAALAEAGDDRGWGEVFAWVTDQLTAERRPGYLAASPVVVAFSYLARHASTGSVRLRRLVDTIRSSWPQLLDDERAWFNRNWPQAAPGGPDPDVLSSPDPGQIQAAATGLLFGLSVPPPDR